MQQWWIRISIWRNPVSKAWLGVRSTSLKINDQWGTDGQWIAAEGFKHERGKKIPWSEMNSWRKISTVLGFYKWQRSDYLNHNQYVLFLHLGITSKKYNFRRTATAGHPWHPCETNRILWRWYGGRWMVRGLGWSAYERHSVVMIGEWVKNKRGCWHRTYIGRLTVKGGVWWYGMEKQPTWKEASAPRKINYRRQLKKKQPRNNPGR